MSKFTKVITREEFEAIKNYLAYIHTETDIEVLEILVNIRCINGTPTMRIAAANYKAMHPTLRILSKTAI